MLATPLLKSEKESEGRPLTPRQDSRRSSSQFEPQADLIATTAADPYTRYVVDPFDDGSGLKWFRAKVEA